MNFSADSVTALLRHDCGVLVSVTASSLVSISDVQMKLRLGICQYLCHKNGFVPRPSELPCLSAATRTFQGSIQTDLMLAY